MRGCRREGVPDDAAKEIWRQMESFQEAGMIRLIGVSNVDLEQLQLLVDKAKIQPAFVQNRCYAHSQWDCEIRNFCREHDICYQGFSLLTANERALNRPEIYSIISRRDITLAQAVFRFALQVGIIPITGTCSQSHMLQDLAVYDFELDPADIDLIEQIAI